MVLALNIIGLILLIITLATSSQSDQKKWFLAFPIIAGILAILGIYIINLFLYEKWEITYIHSIAAIVWMATASGTPCLATFTDINGNTVGIKHGGTIILTIIWGILALIASCIMFIKNTSSSSDKRNFKLLIEEN